MLFCSQKFLLFFAVVFVVYWAMPWRAARVWFLLGASFFFYMSWSAELALVICVSCVIDYCLARGMDATGRIGWRRLMLMTSLVANLGLLCYFKYANFFLRSLDRRAARRRGHSVAAVAAASSCRSAFRSTRSRRSTTRSTCIAAACRPSANLGHFMLFITFFPHLVAGPIVRARDFLPQIARPKHWDWARLHLGAQLFLDGRLQEAGDRGPHGRCGPTVFAHPEQYNTGAAWLAVLAYALQIYCDFSGYTDMAIGRGAHARLQAGEELRHAVPVGQHRRVLAALAHLAVELAARLPVHPARRQPRHQVAASTAIC